MMFARKSPPSVSSQIRRPSSSSAARHQQRGGRLPIGCTSIGHSHREQLARYSSCRHLHHQHQQHPILMQQRSRFLVAHHHPPRRCQPKVAAARRPLSSEGGGGAGTLSESPSAFATEVARLVSKTPDDPASFANLAQRLSPETREQVVKELKRAAARSGAAQSSAAPAAEAATAAVPEEPSMADLKAVALTTAVPFVGFGFMDNAILIVAGDAIDTSLGVVLGISTMCAAALGNIISDVAGIMLGTAIEDFCARYLNLPVPNLTTAQRQLRSVRFANQIGCAVGIVIGCVIGMFPLWYIDSNKIQVRKREAHLESIFRDVITEAGSLLGAQTTTMFLIVHKPEEEGQSPAPTPDGNWLYAKYDADHSDSKKKFLQSERYIPLGRGIISRAALTGTTWNIVDVRSEPDFSPDVVGYNEDGGYFVRNMVCVPVLDAQGRTIAVLQAINKVGEGRIGGRVNQQDTDEQAQDSRTAGVAQPLRGFTTSDVQVLKALASHIGLSLQRMYDSEGDETRIKDTITMLKEYGLEGLSSDQSGEGSRKMLFPDN